MKTLEYSATIFTLTGFFLISNQILLAGFGLSLFSNILWIFWGSNFKAKGLIIVNTFLGFSSIWGISQIF